MNPTSQLKDAPAILAKACLRALVLGAVVEIAVAVIYPNNLKFGKKTINTQDVFS